MIAWPVLSNRRVAASRRPGLHVRSLGTVAYELLTAGTAAATAGFAASQPTLAGVGGGLLAVAGIGLAARPLRILRRPGPASAMAPGRSTPSS